MRHGRGPAAALPAAAAVVAGHALAAVQDAQQRVRVEDYLTTLAAACGEAALAASGFDVEGHDLTPGSPLYWTPVDALLAGDPPPPDAPAPGSVWSVLLGAERPLPDPLAVHRHVAAHVGSVPWGGVATTVPAENRPRVLPLRAAFELRPQVIAAEQSAGASVSQRHLLVSSALLLALRETRQAIDPDIAIRLALEVVVTSAKTAPMTRAAFDAAARDG